MGILYQQTPLTATALCDGPVAKRTREFLLRVRVLPVTGYRKVIQISDREELPAQISRSAMEEFDLIILGGGRASGLAVAAGNAGWRVALIERDKLGGTCPNRGCVPSKLLIGFGETARRVREADRHFVDAEFRGIDLTRAFAETANWSAGVDARYQSRLPENVTLIRGHGRFQSDSVTTVDDRTLTAPKIVIATGTRPRPPAFADLPVWTSDDLFPLASDPPKSLLVIGGGFIGCELGSFLSAVGVDVHLIVRGSNLLPREDGDIGDIFLEEFQRHTKVTFNAQLGDLSHDGSHFHAVIEHKDGTSSQLESERVLFATGRIPNTDDLGLENTHIALTGRGFLQTDDFLRTSVPGIYGAGDVAGRYILQHTASFDVHYLRRVLLKDEDGPIDYGPVPHAVFAEPEVAAVGQTEEELRAGGTPYVSVFEDWLASARAMASRLAYPRVKLLVSPDTYEILGCHLVGPESSTMIHQVLAVMNLKNDVRALAEMIYIHPALNEALLAAAVQAVKKIRQQSPA